MAQTGLFSENLSKDLEKFGVINPPTDLELAELPVDLQRQLAETIKDTAVASEVTKRTPEKREEKLKKIYTILGQAQEPKYGSYSERAKKTKEPPPPLDTIPTGAPPIKASTALKTQQTVSGRPAQTLADVTLTIRTKMPQTLATMMTPDGQRLFTDEEIPQQVRAFESLYEQLQVENAAYAGVGAPRKNEVELYEQALDEFVNILSGNIPVLSEEEVDPEMQGLTASPYVNAYSKQIVPGSIPDYTPAQLKYFKKLNKEKVDKYVNRNYEQFLQTAPRMFYVKKNGIETTISQPVLEHIVSSPTAAIIFSPEIDDEIRQQYDDVYFQLPAVRLNSGDYGLDVYEARAIAKVKAINDLQVGQWFQDPDQKARILADVDKFKDVGIMETRTPFGGTGESNFAEYARLVMSPLTAFASITQSKAEKEVAKVIGAGAEVLESVGILNQLPEGESYYDPDMASRVRLQERKEEAPLYTGTLTMFDQKIAPDSILGEMVDAVARNRGHLDFNTDLAEGLNIDGATKLGMQAAGLTADLLSPDMAVIAAAVKGTKAGAKMFQVQKQVMDATNWKAANEALKQLERTAISEVFDEANLISLTSQLVSPKVAKKLKDTSYGDIRLYMSDNMAQNLEARALLQNQDVLGLVNAGLQDTVYAKTFYELGGAQQADEVFFAKMKESKNIPDMIKQYDEMSSILSDADSIGYDEAVRLSRRAKSDIKASTYKQLDDIYNRAGKQPDVKDVSDQINNAQRMLATVYGRAMFFETSPVIGGLDNIVAITRNTYGTPQARADLLATAKFTKLATSIKEIRKMQVSRQVKPVEFASYNLYGADRVAKQGRVETMYDLTNMTAANKGILEESILELDAPQTYKNYLMNMVRNQNRIFESDINQLVMKNRDDVAIGRRDVFTTENINALPKSQQKKLLEPANSLARIDWRNGFFGQAFDKADDMFGIGDLFKTKKAAENAQKNLTNDVQTFEQARMLNEIQKEMAQLPLQLNRDFRELLKGDVSVRARYVPDSDTKLSKSEVMASLIVGQRQVGADKVVQEDELANTLKWMLDRCFYQKRGGIATQSAGDDVTGMSSILDADIFTSEAREEIGKYLEAIAKDATNNPRVMWPRFQQVVNDLDEMLANNEPLPILLDDGSVQEVLIVKDGLQYTNLRTVSNVELENIMEEMTMGAYFHAEGRRINHRYLVDVVDKQMEQLNIENILPGSGIKQETFERVTRESSEFVWNKNNYSYEKKLELVEQSMKQSNVQDILIDAGDEVDIDTTDIFTSMYKEFDQYIIKSFADIKQEVKNISQSIDEELADNLVTIRKKYETELDEKSKQLKTTLNTDELQEISTVKLDATNKIKNVRYRGAAAKAIRTVRDTTIKSIKKKYTQQRKASLKSLEKDINELAARELQSARKEAQLKKEFNLKQIEEGEQQEREFFTLNLQNKSPTEALEFFVKEYGKEVSGDFNTVLNKLKSETMSDETIDKISRFALDYVTTALRKGGVDTAVAPTLNQLDDKMNALFKPGNEDFGIAILGTEFEALRRDYAKIGIQGAQENIKKVLQSEPGVGTFLYKFFNVHQPIFYFFVLGARTRFHGMNFLTAPFLIYQTLGRFTNPLKGMEVVLKGGRIGSKGADDVAVRSADGMTFTNRQIFERIERSGVKSEYSFIQSVFQDGTLLRYMKNYENANVGFGKKFYDNLMSCVDSINSIGTQTDMAWRSSVFVDAIKDGSSVEEATDLARRSLFDYNDLSDLERKYVMSATVFWNFQRQNIGGFIKALLDPKKLARFMRMYKLKRDMNAIFADNNDGKRIPYEMYMPEYTQTRIIFGQQQGIQDNRQLLMSPSIPGLEASMFLTDVASNPLSTVQEKVNQLLRPDLRLLLGTKQDKYKSTIVNPEYITNLARINDDPQVIADNLSLLMGTTIEPKYVGTNTVGNINGYTYPLDDSQQKTYAYFQDALALIGATTAINDYSRILNPKGTTYEGLSPLQRMLALTGALTPARQKSIVNQQILNIKRQISELRKMQNLERSRAQGDIIRGVTPQQTNPSEQR